MTTASADNRPVNAGTRRDVTPPYAPLVDTRMRPAARTRVDAARLHSCLTLNRQTQRIVTRLRESSHHALAANAYTLTRPVAWVGNWGGPSPRCRADEP